MQLKSPIKSKPFRQAGQSLNEYLSDVVNDRIVLYTLLIIIPLLFCAFEWLRYFRPVTKQPLVATVILLCASGYGLYRMMKLGTVARNYARGRDGEKYVGQILERLRKHGFEVFHDIPCEGFNIDHVLIGPHGVYSIETKTIGKPQKGMAVVKYNGHELMLNDTKLTRDPLQQAKSQAKWLFHFFEERTGKRLYVKPILVFVGWYIEGESRNHDVWVLNENRIENYVVVNSGKHTEQDALTLSRHLGEYIRSHNA